MSEMSVGVCHLILFLLLSSTPLFVLHLRSTTPSNDTSQPSPSIPVFNHIMPKKKRTESKFCCCSRFLELLNLVWTLKLELTEEEAEYVVKNQNVNADSEGINAVVDAINDDDNANVDDHLRTPGSSSSPSRRSPHSSSRRSSAKSKKLTFNQHSSNLPLVLVLNDQVSEKFIHDNLLKVMMRGGVLKAELYKMMLPDAASTQGHHRPVKLICVGFRENEHVQQAHTKAQERRNLLSFLQGLKLNGQTAEGGKIWAWQASSSAETTFTRNHVPSIESPAGLLDFCVSVNMIQRFFFRHDIKARDALFKTWGSVWSPIGLPEKLSVEACGYLGPEITLYFEFLTFYTRALLIPSSFGLLYYFLGNMLDSRWWIGLTLLTTIWSSLFISGWKSKKREARDTWVANNVGMYANTSRVVDLSLVNNEKSTYSHWHRLVSFPLSLVMVAFILRVDYWVLSWKTTNDVWLASEGVEQDQINFFMRNFYSLVPTISKALFINVFNIIFDYVTNLQVHWEQHTSIVQKRNSHVMKLCLFHFVSNFSYLYYYAFIEQDIPKLKSSLMVVLIVSLVIQNFTETALPWLMSRLRLAKDPAICLKIDKKFGTKVPTLKRSRMRVDYENEEYTTTFFDFLELFIQFGQVTLFISVFPLGGVLAFVNNVFEQHGDSYKILKQMNPQKPSASSGVIKQISKKGDESYSINEIWLQAFNGLSFIAVATNIALFAIDNNPSTGEYETTLIFYNNFTWTETVLVLFAVEHLMFLLKGMLDYLLTETLEREEGSITNPQKHFADAARKLHALPSNSAKHDKKGCAVTRAKLWLHDLMNDEDAKKFIEIVQEQEDRLEMAEKERDEAIAWVGEVASGKDIEEHLIRASPLKKKK